MLETIAYAHRAFLPNSAKPIDNVGHRLFFSQSKSLSNPAFIANSRFMSGPSIGAASSLRSRLALGRDNFVPRASLSSLSGDQSMRKIIDLSIPIENDVVSDPQPFGPKVTYFRHKDTFAQMAPFFPGLKQEDLPDGEAWAIEKVELITHNGTHLDAPYHFHSTMDGGKRAWTIDEVPLEWCFAPGVKLDFRHFGDGYVVTADDVQQELERIDYTIKPMDIVVVNTAAGKAYGSDNYVTTGCGMGKEATMYLLERGVRLTGTDAWSWDAPFVHTAKKYAETGDASLIWEGHKAGKEIGYCHLEKLHNLESLPSHGFMISCFPVKIKGASAGWTRAVAMVDQPHSSEDKAETDRA